MIDDGSKWMSVKKLLPWLLVLPLLGVLSRANVALPAVSRPSGTRSGIFTPPAYASRPVSQARTWTASSKPAPDIHINNVNAQGRDIPIDIGSSSSGDVFVETSEPIVEVPVTPPPPYEPLEFRFSGPADPDRLMMMCFAMLIIALPLLLDYSRDWPVRQYSSTEYLSPVYHYIVLALAFLLVCYSADRRFGLSRKYGEHIVTRLHSVGGLVTPAMVATAETSEQLVWGAEDLVFGEGRHLLGVGLAAGLVGLVSQRKPMDPNTNLKTEYVSPGIQVMYLFGAGVVGMLFWNA